MKYKCPETQKEIEVRRNPELFLLQKLDKLSDRVGKLSEKVNWILGVLAVLIPLTIGIVAIMLI